MPLKRILCVLVALPAACASLGAQTLVCGRAPRPPVIDTRPDDACWQDAMIATDFSVLGSGGTERAFRQTTARASWDAEALYLHLILLEPDPASITAQVTERDAPTWMEDAVEVFLQPDLAASDYLHFVINAAGVWYDARNESPGYDAHARIEASIGEQAWQVEMAIPWADLSGAAPAAGEDWGFSLGREHRPPEPPEWSTWAPLKPDEARFAHPALFGRLRFAGRPTPGRAARLTLPEGLAANPDFTDLADGKPAGWRLSGHSTFGEIAPMSRHYAIRNDGDYGIASQPLDIPVEAGQVFTVFAVIRGGGGASRGIAVVQEMQDGRPDDLYPYWDRELTEDFRLYVGRITVDRGARRLQSLSLYRSNRRGWVEYAYVQVVPGAYGLRGIQEAEECTSAEQRGLGEPWPTPALAAFKPLPGGPIKALIFIGEFQRDAVELAQRLDLDYDLVYCPTFRGSGKVDQVVAFGADAILRKLDRHEYDLIILAGRPSDESVITGILDSVRHGTGLVAVEPLAGGGPLNPEQHQRLLDELPSQPLPEGRQRELLGALTAQVLAATSGDSQILESLAVGDLGDGRIARLTWSESVPGLVPFRPGVCEYWEYRWAALARCALWAARPLPAASIESLRCADDLTVQVHADRDEALTLRVAWDTPFGLLGERAAAPLAQQVNVGPPVDGAATVALPIDPRLRLMRGPAVARVQLLAGGAPLDLAACLVPAPQPRVELGEREAPREARPGESIAVTAAYSAQPGCAGTLQADLIDAFGRVVSRSEVTAQPGEGRQARFDLQVRDPLSVYHRVVITAFDGDVIADRQERDLFVPAASADHLGEFRLGVGYAAMHVRCPEYLHDHLVSFLRAHAVEAATVNEYMIQRGMPAFGGQIGARMRYSGSEHVRDPSFCDPEQVAALVARTVENVGNRRHWGFFGFNMEDETHLHQSASVEVDASDHSLSAFRGWARAEYGTIETVNEEWGADYGGFDEITIPLLADMKGAENPARWVDFRLFMERVWADAYAAAHGAVRQAYPDVSLSFTNPYKYDSLSGTNFALWLPHEDVLLRYCHRHVMDRCRSWSNAPILSWFGYRSDARTSGHFIWDFVLSGGTVPFWWDPIEPWAYSGKDGFTPWYLLGPLWRETGRSQAVTAAARQLQGGIGRLLRVAEAEPPEAAILHSQPSMHLLYAQAAMPLGRPTNEGYNRFAASDETIARAVARQGLSYAYALPERLPADALEDVRLLALPSCLALSDEAVAAIRQFVTAGGKVVADVIPATHDEHGRPRPNGLPLADLFDTGQALCLGSYADGDAAAALDEALARLDVQGAIRWRAADGRLPAHTRMRRFRLDGARFLGIVRDPDDEAARDGALTIELPRELYVYDCLAGEALGKLRTLSADLGVGEARFFALLPYRPSALRIEASSEGRDLSIQATVEAPMTPTDHLLRVHVTPAGWSEPALHYCRSVLARRGAASLKVPLALNDPLGRWRIEARDVATGLRATAQVSVTGLQD